MLLESIWRAHEAGIILKVVYTRLLKSETGNALQDVAMASDSFEEKMMVASISHLGLLRCLPNPSQRPSVREVNHFPGSEVGRAMELPPLPATNRNTILTGTNPYRKAPRHHSILESLVLLSSRRDPVQRADRLQHKLCIVYEHIHGVSVFRVAWSVVSIQFLLTWVDYHI